MQNVDTIKRLILASGIVEKIIDDPASVENDKTKRFDARSVKSLFGSLKVTDTRGNEHPAMAACVKVGGGDPLKDDLRTSKTACEIGALIMEMLREELYGMMPERFDRVSTEGTNPKADIASALEDATF